MDYIVPVILAIFSFAGGWYLRDIQETLKKDVPND